MRTGRPSAVSLSATRRPVLPVPPSTRVVLMSLLFCMTPLRRTKPRVSIAETLDSLALRLRSPRGHVGWLSRRATGPRRLSPALHHGSVLVDPGPGRRAPRSALHGARHSVDRPRRWCADRPRPGRCRRRARRPALHRRRRAEPRARHRHPSRRPLHDARWRQPEGGHGPGRADLGQQRYRFVDDAGRHLRDRGGDQPTTAREPAPGDRRGARHVGQPACPAACRGDGQGSTWSGGRARPVARPAARRRPPHLALTAGQRRTALVLRLRRSGCGTGLADDPQRSVTPVDRGRPRSRSRARLVPRWLAASTSWSANRPCPSSPGGAWRSPPTCSSTPTQRSVP